MSHELWGTFSVKGHLEHRAFIADVMLYDRLVIPFPPEVDYDEKGNRLDEWGRWKNAGWDPQRQHDLLKILGKDLLRLIPWTRSKRQEWSDHVSKMSLHAKRELDYAFKATQTILTKDLPPGVTAAEAVAAYPSFEKMRDDMPVSDPREQQSGAGQMLAAIIGRQFLVPDEDQQGLSDEEMLRRAVELASDKGFRRKRASFNRWCREFVRDSIVNEVTLKAALEEMEDLLADERAAFSNKRIKTRIKNGFLIAGIGVSILSLPHTALGWAALGSTAFLKVGDRALDEMFAGRTPTTPSAAAMFHSAGRHFGWE